MLWAFTHGRRTLLTVRQALPADTTMVAQALRAAAIGRRPPAAVAATTMAALPAAVAATTMAAPPAAVAATTMAALPAAVAVTAMAACPLPAAVAVAPTGRLLLPAADTTRLAALPAAGSKE